MQANDDAIGRVNGLFADIRSVEDPSTVNNMLPPEASHVNSGRATTHKIYRDKDHDSHLLLPTQRLGVCPGC